MNNLTPISNEETTPPIALVRGEAFTTLPKDLYIPPDAMEVFLEAFQGPLDLLLYLIKKQNLDILDIPIAEVTRQYMEYVDLIREVSLELAAEYLVMAAILAEIKSRMLLPRPQIEGTEEDPRSELVRRLQEYERFKQAAADLDQLPRQGRDTFTVEIELEEKTIQRPVPTVNLQELLLALADVLKRAELHTSHQIQREPLSVQDKVNRMMAALKESEFVRFHQFFSPEEGRLGVVVTFLAMLELLKDHLVEFVQAAPFAPIHIKMKA